MLIDKSPGSFVEIKLNKPLRWIGILGIGFLITDIIMIELNEYYNNQCLKSALCISGIGLFLIFGGVGLIVSLPLRKRMDPLKWFVALLISTCGIIVGLYLLLDFINGWGGCSKLKGQ